MHRHFSLLLALVTAGCSIDKFLEGEQPPDATLRVGLQTTAVTVIQGEQTSLSASVTRVGDYAGPVTLTVQNVPFGVTADIGQLSTSGAVTTGTLTIRVGPTALPGSYSMVVRGHADPIPDDDVEFLVLTIMAPASYSLGLSQPGLTIAQGGIAPNTVSLNRINYDSPVTLSLSGVAGITATFASNPAAGSTLMTVAVASGVPEGTHEMTLTGVGEGLAARTLKFNVTVIDDPVQLISPSGTSALQASVVSTEIIVNRGGYAGPVELSVEGLPDGVTASFDPPEPTGTTAIMTLTVMPTAVPATYGLSIRGTANGVPDALTEFNLTINTSGVSLALAPASISLFPGSSTLATLSINRVSYTGAIALSVEGVPPGVTVTPNPTSALGASSNVTVSVASGAVPGIYPVTIRAVPAGWPPGLSLTSPLPVTVREIPAGSGNVLLDWNGCTPPDWAAYRNGDGVWTRVVPNNGVVSFLVTASRGGYAWVEAGSGNVSVRFNTQTELTRGPIAMCPPPAPTGKTITGQGVHTGISENATHAFGGATATSSQASPNFTLTNVRDGMHDLVSFGASAIGTRAYVRRDVDLPNGGSLGFVDLAGTGSFVPQSVNVTVTGFLTDVVSHGLNFLTTSACTLNPLYTGRFGAGQVMSAVPMVLQRTDDFHQVVVTSIGSGRTRIVSGTFKNLISRIVSLPGLPFNPTVASVPAPYKVLQITVFGFPILYDGTISFRYSSALRSMSVAASVAYTGTGTTTLAMPDFSTMEGWPAGAGMGVNESGTWNLSLDGGGLNTPLCTDGRITYFFSQTGSF